MVIFLISLMSLYGYMSWMLVSYSSFKHQRNKIKWRIHVNGIRGKSTVTRYTSRFLGLLDIMFLEKQLAVLLEFCAQMEKTMILDERAIPM